MKKRIIVSREEKNYNYEEFVKIDGTWTLTNSKSDNELIKHILNKEIDNIYISDDMLCIKSNNDLIIIKNYSQICNDFIFAEFNERIKDFTMNKNTLNKKKSLQKETPYKKALISPKVLCCATIAGILLMSPVFGSRSIIDQKMDLKETKIVTEQKEMVSKSAAKKVTAIEELKELKELKKIEKPKLSKEEELFISKVKEYSSMFYIEYDRALQIIEEHKDVIKNNYTNQEVGIICVLANHFYNDYSINKTPIIEEVNSLENEKLIIKFANVHGINSVDVLATMIAIHRLETGNGTSEACIYKNNFGGLRARNKKTGEYYVISFKTKEIGAEAFVKTFIKIKNAAMNRKSYNPNQSLEKNINPIYCGEPSWDNKVFELKQEVINAYDLQNYIIKDKEKVLIK